MLLFAQCGGLNPQKIVQFREAALFVFSKAKINVFRNIFEWPGSVPDDTVVGNSRDFSKKF